MDRLNEYKQRSRTSCLVLALCFSIPAAAELLLRDPSVRTLRAVWRQARVVVEAPERCF